MKCMVINCTSEATESVSKHGKREPAFCKPCLDRLLGLKDTRSLSWEEVTGKRQ